MHAKNMSTMDSFLTQNGYCRKLLVKDGSSIYRAVSETLCRVKFTKACTSKTESMQLFLTQAYHHHVREVCSEYIWRHQEEFQDCECINSAYRGLSGIEDMMALSRIYQMEFFVFQEPGISPAKITGSGNVSQVCLVCAEGGHYDLVQARPFVQDLAICQSVVYEVLYRGVFGLSSELEEAVTFIRQQKKNSQDGNGRLFACTESLHKLCERDSQYLGVGAERATPPLPYRIAKALDPVLYRNVELDIVQEEKREIKLRQQGRGFYGVFCPGDKCQGSKGMSGFVDVALDVVICSAVFAFYAAQVQLEEDNHSLYNAHVQEINEPKGPVVVFIEELGEKKTVSYNCLRPLPLSATKPGSESRLPIRELGPLSFGDRRGRRKKSAMPGAADCLPPAPAGRSPRSSVCRRAPDTSQTALTTTTSQPLAVDSVAMPDTLEAQGAGYCVLTTSMPVATQPPMMPVAGSPGTGQGAGSGVVYWMPVVTVPYASNMGQVNLAWAPSQDPYGKDLPISDMNTLRYFFNLGVEYFRISASMQQQQQQPQQQQPQQNYMTTSPLPQLIPSCPPNSSVLMPLDQGASFATPAPPLPQKTKTNAYTHNTAAGKGSSSLMTRVKGAPRSSGGQEGAGKAETMEMSSDMSDSGFTSCGESGQAGDDDVELASNRTDEDSGSTQGEEGGSEKGGKSKGKRKYYMYGPHKLIKPIKDIPPRFQMMLAENSAAKARCEGQPIYMHLSHADLVALEQSEACSGLNADAQCFYPTQPYDTIMVDDTGMASLASTAVVSTHPPPIMVPPPPIMQAAGPSGVSVVYSSLPSSCTSSLPPPPPAAAAFAQPVPAASCAPALSGGGKLIPVVANGTVVGKGPANSGLDKRPDEFARSSSNKAAEVGSSPRVSVSSVSVTGPQPFPVSTSMPPPPAPSLHAGNPMSGGGKQCFYMYPSHSAGFPTMPATPPQGQNHASGISQGQVVYVMNPQGYGPAPPCTGYPPTMMAPPAHTMGMPCPPVAVQ